MADNESSYEGILAERLIRAREVAALLGVKPLTVYRWAAQGKIASLRIGPGGKLLRFRRADVMTLIQRREVQTEDGEGESSQTPAET
jgi:excisionase family DNA binding protein